MRRKPNKLYIGIWNANGLGKRIPEFTDFIHRHQLDAVCVTETRVNPDNRAKIPLFNLYRRDRQLDPTHGGVCIYVRKSIEHFSIDTPNTVGIETVGVIINTATQGKVRLISAYHPPLQTLLEGDLDAIFNDDIPTIVAGDLNSKHQSWNSRQVNTSGRKLLRYVDQRDDIVVIGPTAPTSYSSRGQPDVLDIAVLKNIAFMHHISTAQELSSNHNPVLLHLGEGRVPTETRTSSKVDWDMFGTRLDAELGTITQIATTRQLEEAVGTLTAKSKEAIEYATRTRQVEIGDPQDLPPWIKELIREKHRARRRAQTTLAPVDKRIANNLNEQVKNALWEHRNNKWDDKISSLTQIGGTLWRMARILRNDKRPMPPIRGTRGMVHAPEDKAEVLAETLEHQCRPSQQNVNLEHIEQVEREVGQQLRLGDDDELLPTSSEEVTAIIKSLAVKKAPGPDMIPNKALKAFQRKAIAALTGIINAILRLRYFPQQWKVADVVAIPKPGKDHSLPQNYRHISLLSSLGKVTEAVILKRLKETTEQLGVIPNEQFGFRPRHSTEQQVLRVVEIAASGLEHKDTTGIIFLDVAKAFDKVWHEGLLCKMLRTGYNKATVKLVSSYLRGRQFNIKLDGKRSTRRSLEAGVPQGSLLSPLLFTIFTHDFPKRPGTELAVYADDTAIIAKSRNPRLVHLNLQRAVDALEEWFSLWRIEINPDKSTGLLITRRRLVDPPAVTMYHVPIQWGVSTKYLGVVIDNKLTWAHHIEYIVSNAKAALASMSALIGYKSKLSSQNKLRLYKAIVRPALTYASTAWGYAAETHLKRLQVVQNKSLRMSVAAPWFVRNLQLHADLKMPTLREYIREKAVRNFEQAMDHENPLLREAVDYEINADERRPKRPRAIARDPEGVG